MASSTDSTTPEAPLVPLAGSALGMHGIPVAAKPGDRMKGFRNKLKGSLSINTATPVEKAASLDLFKTLSEGEKITDLYDFNEEIYDGGTKGRVLVAVQKRDSTEVVVKIRVKSSNKAAERNWRTIMLQVYGLHSSDHVLGINGIYEDETSFYIVMPKCNGGEFFEFLATEAEVPESECKRIMHELLTAVGHLHDNNLLHRDIKPENIMFNLAQADDPKSPKTVKLIDFDTCFGYEPGTPKSRQFVGTPGFIAPEALQGVICPQSDLWSIGVILHILMTGEMPWSSSMSLEDGVVDGPSAKKMYQDLKAEVIDWEQDPWPAFPLARDLCQRLMAFETEDRCQDVKEALGHAWLMTT